MGSFFKIVGGLLAGVLLLLVGVGTVVYFASESKLHQRYVLPKIEKPQVAGADKLERGRHLAITRGCLDCHGRDGGGATIIDNAAMGTISGTNITRGKGGLPPSFVLEDWVRAVRHGVSYDGHPLVLMPAAEYSQISEEDFAALVLFMESLTPVDRPNVPVRWGPVGRALLALGKTKLAADEIDHAHVVPAEVTPAVNPTYGKYVAVACTGCHRANFAGGKIEQGPPDWPPAANLTGGPGSRMGSWTEADFITTLRTRRRPDGTTLSPIMPNNIGQLDELELKAIWSYLKTLPPKSTGQEN